MACLSWLVMSTMGCQTARQAEKSSTEEESPRLSDDAVATRYDKLGDRHLASGMAAKAIGYWQMALDQPEVENQASFEIRTLLKMAKAYRSMGRASQAMQKVDAAFEIAARTQNQRLEFSALTLKASIHLTVGQVDQAQSILEECLEHAHHKHDARALAAAYIDYGNLHVYRKQFTRAQQAYADGIGIYRRLPEADLALATALINLAMASMQASRLEEAQAAADASLTAAATAEDNHDKILVLINIGLIYQRLSQHIPSNAPVLLGKAHRTLSQAFERAEQLGDLYASSYALGYLGELYENQDRLAEALQLSQRAAIAARKVNAKEALFRWQWQIGRIFHQLNHLENAIKAYRLSVVTLRSIQQTQVEAGCYGRFQSTLRQDVATVGLELADLLLRQAAKASDLETRQLLLSEAREVVELSKVYELRDYYQDDCVDAARVNVTTLDTVSPKAAIVYPLLLKDRFVLLVSMANGLRQYRSALSNTVVIDTVHRFRRRLEKRTTREYLPLAQTLYTWLIQPLTKDLETIGADTLVFVPSGALRTIPMAALHDGNRFLIEKYALAITPGLYLTDPRPIAGRGVQVLAAGLTESVQGFPSLPFVAAELTAIQNEYDVTLMLNEDFGVSEIETALEDDKYAIVHIASHAQFGESIDNTFLLAFDEKLSLDRLDKSVGLLKYREDPLELLTLSACETAAGDDRAALGLAGVAVKSGARSALATLWHVNDLASSLLIAEFYRQLHHSGISRATALQRAQKKLLSDLRYQHPGYWSPYILINNWL
jgi:CHAT domain-containing protein